MRVCFKDFSAERKHLFRRAIAWLLVIAFIFSVVPVSAQSWQVKAAENTMYGIWCSTCVKWQEQFIASNTAKNTSSPTALYALYNSVITVKCAHCNTTLLTATFEYRESSYNSGTDEESTSYDRTATIKAGTAVTFPVVSSFMEGHSGYGYEDAEDSYQVTSTNNVFSTGAYWSTYQEYQNAKAYAEKLGQSLNTVIDWTVTTDRYGNNKYSPNDTTFTWTDWYDAGKVETSSGTIYHGLTEYLAAFGITAQRVDSYIITFNSNGGDGGSMPAQVSSGGSAVTLTNNTFTKKGYFFAGWSTSASGSVVYGNGASVTPSADMVLYAVWTPNNYNITCIDMDSAHNVELGRTTVQKPYGTNIKGSDFGTDKTTGAYYAGFQFTVGTSTNISDGENVVYRYFAPQPYNVTLVDMVLNESTVLGTDTTLSKLAGDTVRGSDYGTASPYEGYTFNSDTSATVKASGTTVYRYFTPNNYTVSYVDVVADGGKELGRNHIDKDFNIQVSGADMGTDTTVSAYYPGYYYTGNSTAEVVTVNGATVYRYFSPASYDITYISVLNDVAGKELSREVRVGDGVFDTVVSGDVLGTNTSDGAYFAGYSYFASTQETVTTNGATVYRIFKSSSYELNLELNGGILDEPITSYQFGLTTTLPIPYRIGYSFAGWYDNPDFTGNPVTEISDGSTGAKNFYAAWIHDNHTVNLEYAGTGNNISVYRDGAPVEDGSIYYGDEIQVEFGADAGRKQNGYSITETVTDAQNINAGITFTMPDSDVNIITYWLECTELEAAPNEQFNALYKVEPYWDGTSFNIDVEPAITITPDLVDVYAKIYDTRTQQWSSEAVSGSGIEVIIVGNNILTDINETNFTVSADVFGDGYNQQGTFSLFASSGSLDGAMDETGSVTYEDLKSYIDNMENDILLYEQLVIDLQIKLQISNATKEEYANKIEELSNTLEEAKKAYQEAIDANAERIKELQEQLAQKESDYKKQVDELTDQIARIEEELLQEGADVESLTNQKNELSKQLAELIAAHEKETAELQKELDSLNAEIQGYKDTVDALISELESVKEKYETEIANLENELNEIRNKVDDLLAKIAAMEDTIKALLGRDDINISDGSLEDLKEILDNLKNKVNDLNNIINDLNKQIDDLKNQIDDLNGQIDDLKNQVDDLNDKNSSLEDEINKKQDEIDNLNKVIEDLKDRNEALKEENKNASDSSSVSDKELEDVKNELEDAKKENESLNQKMQDAQSKIEEQESVIAALENQKQNLLDEIDDLKKQLADSQNLITELQKQLEAKDILLAQKDQEISNLQVYIAELEQQGIIHTAALQKEKEISLSDAETQVKSLALITVAGEAIKADPDQELLSDLPIITEKVEAETTLMEGDNMNKINPIIIVLLAIGAVSGIGLGGYFLNRKYHFITL